MEFYKLILSIIILLFSANVFAQKEDNISTNSITTEIESVECIDNVESKKSLLSGWYLWEPYQYNKLELGGYKLTGMDVELVKNIADRVGISIKYEPVPWDQHQLDLKQGTRDIAAGATYTKFRAEFVHFSLHYRFEENSLFVMREQYKKLSFETITEFLAQVRLQNFNLGVTEGFIYADSQINLFINDEENSDIITVYENDLEALEGLLKGEIDGFMADRIVGAAAILQKGVNSKVQEILLNAKTPIHLMFSKKNVPLGLVERFNHEIKEFLDTDEYKDIVKTYLYPVMLIQTIDSQWFYIIGVIGTIAFAVSGIAIAAKDNVTLFTTFLFAMLPSVGGGIMRDVIINRNEVGIFLTPSYMYYILIVVLVGFFAIRLLEYYNTRASEDEVILKFWDNILIIGDSIGQAAFIVTGVTIAIMSRIEPIELWGPFFAFLTANGGGILRDLMRQKGKILCVSGTINAEVSVLWGLIFSIFLDINSHNPDPTNIQNTVIIVIVGAFLTRIFVHYFKIPNIKFRSKKKITAEN
ncbi:MAG: transporter substrate-binding domain-containing protein [Rickettsiaceae bacterium]|nr:transporter substrate-binding domain-containing protein [Rickettsiaceae bacterium]